ncbi:unnamed protein product, partial [Allacma fusca]
RTSVSGLRTTMSSSVTRPGNLPNILVLSSDPRNRGEITELLKSVVAIDRYAIYDMDWDEVDAGRGVHPSKDFLQRRLL